MLHNMQELEEYVAAYRQPSVEREYRRLLEQQTAKVVVLDDDPTGVQTVHGVSVYTDWSLPSLRQAFSEEQALFFILTNSRGLVAEDSKRLHREIAENLAAVSRETGRDFQLVSRSDSTLRGHYPMETHVLRDTLERELQWHFDGEILMPFFPEGGRYTVNSIHYMAEKEELRPVGETEFARDKTFGFRSSYLPDWIEEKTNGAYPSSKVQRVTLPMLRKQMDVVEKKLQTVENFGKIVVDAVSYEDVKIFVTALWRVQAATGKRFLYRTAAAFPRVLGGISGRPLLTARELLGENESKLGGLVIVGSHVARTTQQLQRLLESSKLCPLEFNQHLVLQPEALEKEIRGVVLGAEQAIRKGCTAVVYTRRERLDVGGNDREKELDLSLRISDAVTSIVQRLQVRPSWVIAKGGITSSEIGVKGLGVRRALVMGQVLPGVPVWKTGEESKFPGISYVVFPGNVGERNALRDLVESLDNARATAGKERKLR